MKETKEGRREGGRRKERMVRKFTISRAVLTPENFERNSQVSSYNKVSWMISTGCCLHPFNTTSIYYVPFHDRAWLFSNSF